MLNHFLMKFIFSFFIMGFLSFAVCLFLPWWSIAIVCFIVSAWIPQKKWLAFVTGFLSLFVLWAGMALWLSVRNDHILVHKMAPLIIHTENPGLLVLLTGLMGAVIGGFAAFTGSFIRKK